MALALTAAVIAWFTSRSTQKLETGLAEVPSPSADIDASASPDQTTALGQKPQEAFLLGEDGTFFKADSETGSEIHELKHRMSEYEVFQLSRDRRHGLLSYGGPGECQEIVQLDTADGRTMGLGVAGRSGLLNDDGSAFAFGRGNIPPGRFACIPKEVVVVEIATRVERSWSSKAAESEGAELVVLSWSTDGRRILLEEVLNEDSSRLLILDTNDENPRAIDSATTIDEPRSERYISPQFVGDDWSIHAFSHCCAPEYTSGQVKVVRIDPQGSDKEMATFAGQFRHLSMDATGNHWLGVRSTGVLVELRVDGSERVIREGIQRGYW